MKCEVACGSTWRPSRTSPGEQQCFDFEPVQKYRIFGGNLVQRILTASCLHGASHICCVLAFKYELLNPIIQGMFVFVQWKTDSVESFFFYTKRKFPTSTIGICYPRNCEKLNLFLHLFTRKKWPHQTWVLLQQEI